MIRGEIREVDFEPELGSEASERRPAVVVSNDGANTTAAHLNRGVITVVPVTSSVERIYPFQFLLHATDYCGSLVVTLLGVDSTTRFHLAGHCRGEKPTSLTPICPLRS